MIGPRDTHQTRQALLQQLESAQRRVSHLLESMAHAQDWQADPNEWSFRYIAAYLATVERNCFMERIHRLASGENPYIEPYANTGFDFLDTDLRDSLAEWATARQELLTMVRNLTIDSLEETGTHEILGTVTTLDALAEVANHDQEHLNHLRVLIEDYEEMNP